MNICIIGGGNIGSILVGDLASKPDINIRLLTGSSRISEYMDVFDANETFLRRGKPTLVTNDEQQALDGADIVLSTVPSNAFGMWYERIRPYLTTNMVFGKMPAGGGIEFTMRDFVLSGGTLFGFARVHSIARIKEKGRSVYDLGRKDKLYIASMPQTRTQQLCELFQKLLDIPCEPLPCFAAASLTPSNPILHTTRLYSMFHDYHAGMLYDHNILFYREWTDDASRMLLACDNEAQHVRDALSHASGGRLDLSSVKSLSEHYESPTATQLTKKIMHIPAFAGITSPMINTDSGYIPDFSSRYFTEDFPYGLAIYKSYATVCGQNTPHIDLVLKWYEHISEHEYYTQSGYNGKDLALLPLPQNNGFNSASELSNYYLLGD